MSSLADGTICTAEELALSSLVQAPLHCLTRGESLGLLGIVIAAFSSLISVLFVFVLIIKNVLLHAWYSPGRWRLIKNPMDLYMLSLFAADLVHAISRCFDTIWLRNGKLEIGGLCRAQGIFILVGSMTIALSSLVIMVHTFINIWRSKITRSLTVPSLLVAGLWIWTILFAVVPLSVYRRESQLFYAPVPYWCWISKKFLLYRIFGEWLWLWLSLLVSVLLYIPLFFWSLGFITVEPEDPWWKFKVHKRRPVWDASVDSSCARARSFIPLIYPLVFCVLVLPSSIGRWIAFAEENTGNKVSHVSPATTMTVIAIWNALGLVDVVLFFTTRQGLLLFGSDPRQTESEDFLSCGSESQRECKVAKVDEASFPQR